MATTLRSASPPESKVSLVLTSATKLHLAYKGCLEEPCFTKLGYLPYDSVILCNLCRNRAGWGRSSIGQSLGLTSHSRLSEVHPNHNRSPAMLLPLTTVTGIDRPLSEAAFRSASPRFQLGSVTAPETKSTSIHEGCLYVSWSHSGLEHRQCCLERHPLHTQPSRMVYTNC